MLHTESHLNKAILLFKSYILMLCLYIFCSTTHTLVAVQKWKSSITTKNAAGNQTENVTTLQKPHYSTDKQIESRQAQWNRDYVRSLAIMCDLWRTCCCRINGNRKGRPVSFLVWNFRLYQSRITEADSVWPSQPSIVLQLLCGSTSEVRNNRWVLLRNYRWIFFRNNRGWLPRSRKAETHAGSSAVTWARGKISWGVPVSTVRGPQTNTQQNVEKWQWILIWLSVVKPEVTGKYSEKCEKATTNWKPKVH